MTRAEAGDAVHDTAHVYDDELEKLGNDLNVPQNILRHDNIIAMQKPLCAIQSEIEQVQFSSLTEGR